MSSGSRVGSADAVKHLKVERSSQLEELYTVGKKLGEGTFGTVVEACCKEDGKKWAIKKINKKIGISDTTRNKSWEREVYILRNFSHTFMIGIREVIESDRHCYLVMELCESGTLSNELQLRLRFSEEEARLIMCQLAQVVSYLHLRKIVHRDLKLENILIKHRNPMSIRLTDFGLSTELQCDSVMMATCGTPLYMAPEVLRNRSYTQLCDVWSMGIIMYILIAGTSPFRAQDEQGLYEEVCNFRLTFDGGKSKVLQEIGAQCKEALSMILKQDARDRLTSFEFCNHKWITGKDVGSTNILQLMKEFNEDKTQTATNGLDKANPSVMPFSMSEPSLATAVSDPARVASHVRSAGKPVGKNQVQYKT